MKDNRTIEYKVIAHHITNYSEDRKLGTDYQGEYLDLKDSKEHEAGKKAH
jgi:hypothetical protein